MSIIGNNIRDYIKNNSIWTSRNEKIDSFIRGRQSYIDKYEDTVIEWIPYNQFNEVKEICKSDHITLFSAIWKDGPLYKRTEQSKNYVRDSNKKVVLKCLHNNNSQNPFDFLKNEAIKYPLKRKAFLAFGNEKIDYFIHEMQLRIKVYKDKANEWKYNDTKSEREYEDTVIEWIPYNQFNEIRETGKIGRMMTIYSAIWENGPYRKNKWSDNYTRVTNKEVALNCLHIDDSQDPIDFLINEAKKYSSNHEAFLALYGISQNPNTNDYILVQKNYTLTSGNEKIDCFIYKMQLKINKYEDAVIEWISYNQFDEIKKTGNIGHITVYSAIWKDGPLCKNYKWGENYTRNSDKEVALYCLHINDSQDPIDFLINEAKKYSTKHKAFLTLYGISQNPDTNDYILVQKNHTLTSGNEKIDYFIHERQLKMNKYEDTVIEWIPYEQFNKIKKITKCGHISVYSAIWKDGPLYKMDESSINYTRDSNKKVALKCFHINYSPDPIDYLINEIKKYSTKHEAFLALDPNKKVALKILHINSPDPIDFLINEAKEYSTNRKAFLALYGISQDPSTNDYILVQNNCTLISGNEKIDYFIHKMQLNIRVYYNTAIKRGYDDYDHHTETEPEYEDIVIEWIPYNQFDKIKETGKIGHMTIYSAIWKDGPLYKNKWSENFVRNSNKEIALKCLHINNSQDPVDFLINEDMIIEWIPYDQFDEIEEIGNNSHITVYSATWKDGPLRKNNKCDENFTRDSYIKVILKCLHVDNLQDPIDFLISEAKEYSSNHKAFLALYGISQDPNTNDYILVQNNCTLISGNEKIDDFIHEMQLKIKVTSNGSEYNDTVIEWIPYNQLNEIKETNKSGYMIIYSAIWKDGPLYKNKWNGKYLRDSNKEVALKCLHINNSQDPVDFLIKEAKKYSTNRNAFLSLYGISQNPNTDDYILVQNNCTLISGIEKIDYFIHEMQLNMSVYSNASFRREYDDYDYTELEVKYEEDMVIEWIPYNQFNEIKKIGKIDYMTIDSAIWKDGPLYMDRWSKSYIRDPNKKVALKCLHINNNSQDPVDFLINEVTKWEDGPLCKNEWYQNFTRDSYKEVVLRCLHISNIQDPIDFLINEAKKYSTNHNAFLALYGISQNPNTNDYILVQKNYTLTSGNEKIDYLIHEMQLKMCKYEDTVIEWIPYNQFDDIKEIGKNCHITVHSAVWKDGPLYRKKWSENFTRESNIEMVLKCLHISDSQDPIDLLTNEAKKCSTKHKAFLALYGISQNPNTNDYILIQKNYTLLSGNEKIDEFIHAMQLKVDEYNTAFKWGYDDWEYKNTMIEWIAYNRFDGIKKTGKRGHVTTVYSAIWKDGPLKYNYNDYTRNLNKEVTLNSLHINDSQDPIDFLINEAKKYSTRYEAFLTFDYVRNSNKEVSLKFLHINSQDSINFLISEAKKYSTKHKAFLAMESKWSENYTRDSNKEVALNCLHINTTQDPVDFLINEAKKYSAKSLLALFYIINFFYWFQVKEGRF
ncbi:kinase-like domain-containing protein [Rhizophagus clarus]|uniref:Kinase-like domain-containing protein n=1 Tax=Rhizophagus clarus TaxID=94130 RepID=A0A8H3L9T3_9GLOM|nr:kinase-like domain-containing protein [Rhizophagus clarus]